MITLAAMLLGAAPAAEPVRLATYRYPRYDRAQALQPMRQLLEARLRRPVRVDLYESPDALRDAITGGRVDVAMTNLASYLGVIGTPRLEAVAVLDVPAATLDRYRGVLLAKTDAGARTLADLKGREPRLRYAEVLPGSTSGALVQTAAMREAGVDPSRFTARVRTGTHDGALAALTENRADLAALAEEPWRKAAAEVKAAVVQLWRSAPLPPGPVVCVARVSFDCKAVRSLLLGRGSGAAATELSKGWSETEGATRFRRVRAEDYGRFFSEVP